MQIKKKIINTDREKTDTFFHYFKTPISVVRSGSKIKIEGVMGNKDFIFITYKGDNGVSETISFSDVDRNIKDKIKQRYYQETNKKIEES